MFNHKFQVNSSNRAISFIQLAVLTLGLSIFTYALYLVINYEDEKGVDGASHSAVKRPIITDRNGVVLAQNIETISVFKDPKITIDYPNEVVDSLVKIFPHLNKEKLRDNLINRSGFFFIERQLTDQAKEAFFREGIPTISYQFENKRFYPYYNLTSHFLGYVNVDGKGVMGVERWLEDSLSKYTETNTSVTTAIDIKIQSLIHYNLNKSILQNKAKGGFAVLMKVKTGEVISMVSFPDFNPNNYKQEKVDNFFNPVVMGVYEMGSGLKAINAAIGLDTGAAKLSSIYDATKPYKIDKFTIHDFKGQNRWLSFKEVLIHSSNIGALQIALSVGTERQKTYLEALGLTKRLESRTLETTTPLYPREWREINTATIAYGHGISITPLHLMVALNTLMNKGVKINPTFLKQAKEPVGERIFSEQTANTIVGILRETVLNYETVKLGKTVISYAGKTGTAEKVVNGKYDKKLNTSSFIAGFPAEQPQYLMLVVLDEPTAFKDFNTGGRTVIPVFEAILAQIYPYLITHQPSSFT